MTHLSKFRRGAAVLASAGLLCGVLGSGAAVAANPASTPAATAHGPYKGRVVARHELTVRTGPGTNYRAVGSLRHGEVVTLVCKVNGQNVRGNSRWYKLREGRYAWASARYLRPLGAAPGWCGNRHHR
ncbi:SH3 domain-containing protein [Streptomyces sp. NPDC057743]|uniref:SH3 domain-containing protein n=1 Tax=Streptomyces sp. NPDC057743 TaxID=3346236 RepID=UPI0036A0CCA2